MFERALEDPGENAVRRVVRLSRVSSVGLIVGDVLYVIQIGLANPVVAGLYMAISVVSAAGAWVTAEGLENRRPWARNAGFAIAVLSLFSIGIGTIFGLIELYSLWRAQRGGKFTA